MLSSKFQPKIKFSAKQPSYLKAVVEEWKLEDKLACISTDNGRNIVLAVEKLG